jgi:NadR type nicotinamide-nucleotide adenylyltransferase
VMIGPESTGKTTLCKMLSTQFNEPWVPEFARDYLTKINRPYTKEDLVEIAKGQIESEEKIQNLAHKFLFCDTDLLVIKVWSNHLYKQCDEWILNQIETRKYHHYFLCKNDFPWEKDTLRENPELGNYFYSVFKNILLERKQSFTELEGDENYRLNKAIEIIGELNFTA